MKSSHFITLGMPGHSVSIPAWTVRLLVFISVVQIQVINPKRLFLGKPFQRTSSFMTWSTTDAYFCELCQRPWLHCIMCLLKVPVNQHRMDGEVIRGNSPQSHLDNVWCKYLTFWSRLFSQRRVTLWWVSAVAHLSSRNKWMRSTDSSMQPRVCQPWSSCGTSTTPVSAGGSTQPGCFWRSKPEVLPGAGHVGDPNPLQGTVPVAPKWLKGSGLQKSPPRLQLYGQSFAIFSHKTPHFF